MIETIPILSSHFQNSLAMTLHGGSSKPNNISTLKLLLASFHLEGVALQWLHWLTKIRGPLTWEEFTMAVLHRLGPTDYEDPSEALSRLKQTTTVAAFEQLSHRVDGLHEPYLKSCLLPVSRMTYV